MADRKFLNKEEHADHLRNYSIDPRKAMVTIILSILVDVFGYSMTTNIQSIAQIISPLIATGFIQIEGLTIGIIFLNQYELIGYLAVMLGIGLFIILYFDLKRHPYLFSYEKLQKESVESN